jgi:hypothetical protein
LARPLTFETFIQYNLPVYPGAQEKNHEVAHISFKNRLVVILPRHVDWQRNVVAAYSCAGPESCKKFA